jgi:ribosomal protein L7Ae-like RNA K-turn-binding protein
MLGMAMRAGKLVTGEEGVVLAIRQNKVNLVFLAEDASPNTTKKITDKSIYYKVPVMTVESRYELGHAIGKAERVVVGISDKGFANKMKTLAES